MNSQNIEFDGASGAEYKPPVGLRLAKPIRFVWLPISLLIAAIITRWVMVSHETCTAETIMLISSQ